MGVCISTSNALPHLARRLTACLALVVSLGGSLSWVDRSAYAAEDKTQQPEEDDFSSTPYTEYGEFNEEENEASDMKFYQYGRLFGFGFGVGYSGATGNRGKLYQGGFPLIEVRTQYFFDFNLAMGLSLMSMKHTYEVSPSSHGGHHDVSIVGIGVDFKYYFETKDLAATISFANPYIVGGIGSYTITDTSTLENTTDKDASFAINGGLGMEFAINPRKTYFTIEGRVHQVNWGKTDHHAEYALDGFADNQSGLIYSVVTGFTFSW